LRFVGGMMRFRQAWEMDFAWWEPVGTLHLFAIAALFGGGFASRPHVRASLAALLAGDLAIEIGTPLTSWYDMVRYRLPLVLVFVLVVCIASLRPRAPRLAPRMLVTGVLTLLAATIHLYARHEKIRSMYDDLLNRSLEVLDGRASETPHKVDRNAYAALQHAIPQGEHVLSMLDAPYLLDFRRNTIAIIDLPAVASPGPGLPLGGQPEQYASYLLAQGYRYLAFVRSDRSAAIYKLSTWTAHATSGDRMPQHFMARSVIDVIVSLEALAETHHVVYDDGTNVVVDLGASRDAKGDAGRAAK
jgi:hypothetical protein